MRISVITPTADRPRGIELCERWMARQTVQPDEWIVADGGQNPAPLTMGQVHLHEPGPPGAANLAGNLLRALDAVTGDMVVIVEDDDYYRPTHIEECARGLQAHPVYGCRYLLYVNVQHRCWIQMGNRGAALCQTAFRRSEIPAMRRAAKRAIETGTFCIDGIFWQGREALARGPQTVIGIKGLPGTPGLGIGHRPKVNSARRPWQPDPNLDQLRRLIGADAEAYLCT